MQPIIPQQANLPGGSTSLDIPPGNPQGYKQDLSLLFPKAEGEPLLLPFDVNGLAAGNAITFECESGVPEFWYVSLRPVANTRASIYNGPESSGIPYRLGGGGFLKVRAKSEFLTIVSEVGGAAIIGTVVAARKVDFSISGGAV